MDKFVVREPKKDPHLAVNKSAKDRAAQYPGVFHADNGLLFCSTCNIVLDLFLLRKSAKRVQCSNEFMFLNSHLRCYVTQWSATRFCGGLTVYTATPRPEILPLTSQLKSPFGDSCLKPLSNKRKI